MTLDSPFVIFAISLVALVLANRLGMFFRRRRKAGDDAIGNDLGVVTTASLTLLALLISFSFSMATSRYDARKNFEVQEAGQIGAEYLRSDLLPAEDRKQVKSLLLAYLDQRLKFYQETALDEVPRVRAETDRLQVELWKAVEAPAVAQPNAVVAIPVAGVDSVIGARSAAEAAWQNRIPNSAGYLLLTIAFCANMLVGFAATIPKSKLHFVLPLLISTAFFLIADIENPRIGIIRVYPVNLQAVAAKLHSVP